LGQGLGRLSGFNCDAVSGFWIRCESCPSVGLLSIAVASVNGLCVANWAFQGAISSSGFDLWPSFLSGDDLSLGSFAPGVGSVRIIAGLVLVHLPSFGLTILTTAVPHYFTSV